MSTLTAVCKSTMYVYCRKWVLITFSQKFTFAWKMSHNFQNKEWRQIKDACCRCNLIEHLLFKLYDKHDDYGPYSISFLHHRKLPERLAQKRSCTVEESISQGEVEDKKHPKNIFQQHICCQSRCIYEKKKGNGKVCFFHRLLTGCPEASISMSKMIYKEREEGATRELEVIWWPNWLNKSNCWKFQLHHFYQEDTW